MLEKATGVRAWAPEGMASHLRQRARGAGFTSWTSPATLEERSCRWGRWAVRYGNTNW
ncbi:protein of unknown function [Candidatus Bipolaricaulis anaerobius]|uniref:Uncharacterized protein n=1 Tax=Candidatus Bipolaricaulis anaerobius TaxID=2026885 RepID=A0A2X3KW61_9BACT|nr:protein of unknown function [Candidatus Bipolaricaulis anaerobius]